jgi:hypothetical protein
MGGRGEDVLFTFTVPLTLADDHVHHLLFLLSQPEQSTSFPSSSPPSESAPETAPETIPEDAELPTSSTDIGVPTEVVPPTSLPASRRESEFGVPNGHATELSSTNDEAGVGGVTEPKSGYGGGSGGGAGGAGGALNFLQEDELQGALDESFEMVPSMASHEVSGLTVGRCGCSSARGTLRIIPRLRGAECLIRHPACSHPSLPL